MKSFPNRDAFLFWDKIKLMFYTYILQSELNNSYYIGHTGDLDQRLWVTTMRVYRNTQEISDNRNL